MARDEGLEDVLADDLAGECGLTSKPMFGGLVWLCDGHLCLAARHDGLLARLGPGHEAWALQVTGIRPMTVGARPMPGWIWAEPDICGDDGMRRRLVADALAFVRALPAKRTRRTSRRTGGIAVPLDLFGVRDAPVPRPRKC